tara:strand:+ start:5122 stop:5811 length:690 start_codon:yes stop_codon:yes gene_type:complete
MSNFQSYINTSNNKARSEQKEWKLFGNIDIFIKDPFVNVVNMQEFITKFEHLIPERLTYGLDSIYIGHFKEFEERELNAFFEDGTIYLSNVQDSVDDLLDDAIHELAHSVEEQNGFDIYGDGRLEKEFLGKRKKLYFLLKEEGYDIHLMDFLRPEYSREFDNLLYKKIGYSNLRSISDQLFYSPYGATSLREYFANAFEAFFVKKDFNTLQTLSPVVYNKIEKILERGE